MRSGRLVNRAGGRADFEFNGGTSDSVPESIFHSEDRKSFSRAKALQQLRFVLAYSHAWRLCLESVLRAHSRFVDQLQRTERRRPADSSICRT